MKQPKTLQTELKKLKLALEESSLHDRRAVALKKNISAHWKDIMQNITELSEVVEKIEKEAEIDYSDLVELEKLLRGVVQKFAVF